MRVQGIDAYIIPSSDPHISEYLPERYKCIAWVSGFTGSAGTLVITQRFAGLWTDARYFVQATEQLAGSGFELVKLKAQGAAEFAGWLTEHLPAGSTIAFDGQLVSVFVAQSLITTVEKHSFVVQGGIDLLAEIWPDRPSLPSAPARLIPVSVAGKTVTDKLTAVRAIMKQQGAERHLISTLDDVAWLFNIRGADVPCNPVVLAFALISESDATLYIDEQKLSPAFRDGLDKEDVLLAPYEQVHDALRTLPAGNALLLDPRRTCYAWYCAVPPGVRMIGTTNPSTLLKAIKNETEITHTREVMVRDGLALTRFFRWLEGAAAKESITEISIAEKLRDFRAEQPGFIGESFDTIAGYKAHGALPHYKATPQSNAVLEADGLLLVDSGGQYETGTTDITRVISLGNLTDGEKDDYTLVLKGMIEGSTTVFPQGSRGYQIDAVTRKPLWDHLKNYGHGTGHGVGFALNVHEGPHVFNTAPVDVVIEPGMITSIEPGLYLEGRYGIRIENLVLSAPYQGTEFGEFYHFETLTLCYIDTSLINTQLLDKKHIDWINSYHDLVYNKLSPYLDEAEKRWLKGKCETI